MRNNFTAYKSAETEQIMAINGLTTGINNNVSVTEYGNNVKAAENHSAAKGLSETDAVVYEKSGKSDTETTVTSDRKVDEATIEQLKADAEQRTAQLRGIVEKLLLKQAGTQANSEGLASVFRKLEVDDEIREQAKADIAEDGYWGVEQTSDRMVSFAQALAGDDPELAEKMIDAFKEGYKQAEEAWGEELPQISKDTYDRTLEKLNKWVSELKGVDGTAEVEA